MFFMRGTAVWPAQTQDWVLQLYSKAKLTSNTKCQKFRHLRLDPGNLPLRETQVLTRAMTEQSQLSAGPCSEGAAMSHSSSLALMLPVETAPAPHSCTGLPQEVWDQIKVLFSALGFWAISHSLFFRATVQCLEIIFCGHCFKWNNSISLLKQTLLEAQFPCCGRGLARIWYRNRKCPKADPKQIARLWQLQSPLYEIHTGSSSQ